jgi:hypothetical protein
VNNFQYTLTDLDPNDGVAPAVTWGSGTSSSSIDVSAQTGTEPYPDATLVAPTYTSLFKDTNTAIGPLGTSTALASNGHAASTGAQGLTVSQSVPLGALWRDVASFNSGFTLSPNTAITFSAQAQGTLSVNVPPSALLIIEPNGYRNNGYMDWAYTQAYGGVGIRINNKGNVIGDTTNMYLGLRSNVTSSVSDSKLISATFSNATGSDLSATVSLSASLDGYTVASIPEASTWAQMTLGLIGLGAVISRRRRLAQV